MNFAAKTAYVLMCAAALALAASGIGVFAFGHPPMTHWVLLAHLAAAPFFAIALAVVSLTWSGLGRRSCNGCGGAWDRVVFWIVLACGLVVILSGVVPMTPIFGGNGQRVLYLTHRYGGITLAAAILVHLVTLRRRRVIPSRLPNP